MLTQIQNRLKCHCSEAVLVEFGPYEAVRNKKSPSLDWEVKWRKSAKHVISCTYWREAFCPPPVFQALRQRAKTDAQTVPRCCLLRNPLGNVTRLEEPAHCVIHVAFCLAIWRGAFSVSQCFASALHRQQVPDCSYPQCCLPAAPPIQDGAPCVSNKTGQGEGMICLLGKLPSSPMLLHGCSCPCMLYVSKNQVPFIFLPFPSSAGFHSQGNARAPFTWLLTPHQNSSYFTPSTAILFGFFCMFLYLTILEPMTTSLDFSGSFPLILSFQSCFYNPKHPIFFSQKS